MTQALSPLRPGQAAPGQIAARLAQAGLAWRRLRWQTASALFPEQTARAFERAWFGVPDANVDAAGQAFLAGARADWALVTGGGATRRVRVYRWHGEGPAVLLAHGWGGNAAHWQALVPALLAAGHRVVAFDALSHGASDAGALGPGQSSLIEMSRALLAAAWHAGPIHAVVAHSLGSAAAALALREGLPAAAAVLIGAPADMRHASATLAWQLGVAPAVLARVQRNSEQWLGMPWGAFNVPDIGRCRPVPPTLVVHDRHDKEVRWEDGAAIAGSWPGATLLTTEGLGHRRILRDAGVIDQVVAFLAQRLSSRGAPAAAIPPQHAERTVRLAVRTEDLGVAR